VDVSYVGNRVYDSKNLRWMFLIKKVVRIRHFFFLSYYMFNQIFLVEHFLRHKKKDRQQSSSGIVINEFPPLMNIPTTYDDLPLKYIKVCSLLFLEQYN
jgi:hypothetical protein